MFYKVGIQRIRRDLLFNDGLHVQSRTACSNVENYETRHPVLRWPIRASVYCIRSHQTTNTQKCESSNVNLVWLNVTIGVASFFKALTGMPLARLAMDVVMLSFTIHKSI